MTDIRIGTRGSRLAVWQANHVKQLIEQSDRTVRVEIVAIKTRGDEIHGKPLPDIGGKGLFTREIEEALLKDQIQIAVHSLKDLPSELPDGLKYAGSPKRDDPRDCFISSQWENLDSVPDSGRIATGSMRRKAQIHEVNPKITCGGLRGNIDTRLRKLDEQGWDGIIMAAAALVRLKLTGRVSAFLDPERFVPAVGQGAIGLEVKAGHSDVEAIIGQIVHGDTVSAVLAERAFMGRLEGGCSVPLGAWGRQLDDQLVLTGYFASPDGQKVFRDTVSGPQDDPTTLGRQLAERFRARGTPSWVT